MPVEQGVAPRSAGLRSWSPTLFPGNTREYRVVNVVSGGVAGSSVGTVEGDGSGWFRVFLGAGTFFVRI
jgi:hypothetical protein